MYIKVHNSYIQESQILNTSQITNRWAGEQTVTETYNGYHQTNTVKPPNTHTEMDAYAVHNPHAATVSLKSSPSEKLRILNHAHCRIPFTEHSRTNKRYLWWWKGNQRLGARDRGGNWLQRGGREFDVMGYFMSWWGWSYLHAHRLSKTHQAVHLKWWWFIHVQRDFLKLLSKRTKDLTRHITEKMSEWPISLWKDVRDDLVSGEHRLKSQWVALNAHLGRVELKHQTATNAKMGPGDSQTRAAKWRNRCKARLHLLFGWTSPTLQSRHFTSRYLTKEWNARPRQDFYQNVYGSFVPNCQNLKTAWITIHRWLTNWYASPMACHCETKRHDSRHTDAGGHGSLLQCWCLGNPTDREPGQLESTLLRNCRTQLSDSTAETSHRHTEQHG